MSNSTSISEEASASSETRAAHDFNPLNSLFIPISEQQQPPPQQPKSKKKRSQPGNPDPDAEVIAMSPKSLMATNRFVCEICNKGFQRDQNLQLHRRGHNLPWKLRQRSSKEIVRKRVYVCPEPSCVHHHPSRALGDLTGIKKHFCRKHGEKTWKCDKCSKRYAVHSDWKVHVKTCGTREYRCDCGTLFSRKDSFITHRAFCDALAEESARLIATTTTSTSTFNSPPLLNHSLFLPFSSYNQLPHPNPSPNPNPNPNFNLFHSKPENPFPSSLLLHPYLQPTTTSPHLSATALLQKATTMGPMPVTTCGPMGSSGFDVGELQTWQRGDRLTRDFLGVAAGETEEELLSFTGHGMDLVSASHSDQTKQLNTFGFPPVSETWSNC